LFLHLRQAIIQPIFQNQSNQRKKMNTQSTVFSDSKSHYEILDGLRGVAAVTVVIFHLLEIFSEGDHLKQIINHGYLAVDFFFLLSGFVIGHAYDDRWDRMTLREFFKRRLIRLHPMIVIAMVIGAIGFCFSASPTLFPHINEVPFWKLILVMLIGFTLLPVSKSLDIRGWEEMHPLNGPAWTLFFEYIANILYALFLRKLSNKILVVLVFLAGFALVHLAVTGEHGDVIGGWSFDATQLRIGLTRLLYPFLAGLLLSRIFKPKQIKNAFVRCSLLLIIVLSIPRIGGAENLWMNGLYDSLSIIFVFPLIVYLGASGEVMGKFSSKTCRFLGDISYPIYLVHYPLIYIYSAWAVDNKDTITTSQILLAASLVLVSSIAIAYISLKLFDIPVRKWLTKRFMTKVE
jgi:peptidoglycan/LPS O-acetylase OafA/YrhL